MTSVLEMAKSSGGYAVFSGAQSWSNFFLPQQKIVKSLGLERRRREANLRPREHRRSATQFGHL